MLDFLIVINHILIIDKPFQHYNYLINQFKSDPELKNYDDSSSDDEIISENETSSEDETSSSEDETSSSEEIKYIDTDDEDDN